MNFVWDARKASANIRKHGVSFEEASTVFADPNAIEWFDEEHSTEDEDGFVALGASERARLLIVVHTERDGDTVRIIGARKATPTEGRRYGQGAP